MGEEQIEEKTTSTVITAKKGTDVLYLGLGYYEFTEQMLNDKEMRKSFIEALENKKLEQMAQMENLICYSPTSNEDRKECIEEFEGEIEEIEEVLRAIQLLIIIELMTDEGWTIEVETRVGVPEESATFEFQN